MRNLTAYFFSCLFILIFSACQSGPTKIYEDSQAKEKSGQVISTETIILDARPAFEYSLSHLPSSYHMRWEDFAQKAEPFKGLLEKDLFFHARRLARYGITPASKILIVGRAHQGKGEEGRLAWTLRLMGLKNIQTKSIDAFSIPLTKQESSPKENATIWKPEVDLSLDIEKDQFLKDVMRPHGSKDYPIVIDVRTEAEYLGKDSTSFYSQNAPDLGAVNINFKEFFLTNGDVNREIKSKLEAINITADKKIYVIDEMGVRSAAVTLALRELGYARASNFSGGYMLLMGAQK